MMCHVHADTDLYELCILAVAQGNQDREKLFEVGIELRLDVPSKLY